MLSATTFALASAALFCMAVASPLRAQDEPKRTISVSASGEVLAEPDRAAIQAGVMTESPTAKTALAGNSKKMAAIINGLKAAGVDAKDIQTSRFDVQPVYDNPKTGAPTIRGYRVINQVHLTVRAISDLGELIDRIVSLGANQINSIRFEVSDMEVRKDQARREAMRNAIRRASLYAQAAGATLGDVLTINEQVSGGPVSFETRGAGRIAASAAPIAPGQMALEVSVHVTWALK